MFVLVPVKNIITKILMTKVLHVMFDKSYVGGEHECNMKRLPLIDEKS